MGDVENCDHGHAAPRRMLAELPDSQAGMGRHKCPVCAYYHGFQAGMAVGLGRAQAAASGVTDQAPAPSTEGGE